MPSSSIEATLAAFVAGAAPPERLVLAVAAAYYGASGAGRERWRPLIDVIDRASPGIVELGSVRDTPGFEVRLAERPFPKAYEAALREAAAAVLGSQGAPAPGPAAPRAAPLARRPAPRAGLIPRVVAALRRLFSASA